MMKVFLVATLILGHSARAQEPIPDALSTTTAAPAQTGSVSDPVYCDALIRGNAQTCDAHQCRISAAREAIREVLRGRPDKTAYDPLAPDLKNQGDTYAAALNDARQACGNVACTAPNEDFPLAGTSLKIRYDVGVWEQDGRCKYGPNATRVSVVNGAGKDVASALNGMWLVKTCGNEMLIVEGPNRQLSRSATGHRSGVIIDNGKYKRADLIPPVLVGDARTGFRHELKIVAEAAGEGHGERLKLQWTNGDFVAIDAASSKFATSSLGRLGPYTCAADEQRSEVAADAPDLRGRIEPGYFSESTLKPFLPQRQAQSAPHTQALPAPHVEAPRPAPQANLSALSANLTRMFRSSNLFGAQPIRFTTNTGESLAHREPATVEHTQVETPASANPLGFVFAPPPAEHATVAPARTGPTPEELRQEEDALLGFLNARRQERGLEPLTRAQGPDSAAEAGREEMIAGKRRSRNAYTAEILGGWKSVEQIVDRVASTTDTQLFNRRYRTVGLKKVCPERDSGAPLCLWLFQLGNGS